MWCTFGFLHYFCCVRHSAFERIATQLFEITEAIIKSTKWNETIRLLFTIKHVNYFHLYVRLLQLCSHKTTSIYHGSHCSLSLSPSVCRAVIHSFIYFNSFFFIFRCFYIPPFQDSYRKCAFGPFLFLIIFVFFFRYLCVFKL